MKKLLPILCVLLPLAAPAQNLKLNRGHMEVAGSAWYNQAEVGVETRLGVFAQDYLQAGLQLGWADNDFADRTYFGLYAYRMLETRGYGLPYFGAGLGYGSVDLGGWKSVKAVEFSLLSGIKYYLTDNVALNTELMIGFSAGDTYISDNDLDSKEIGLTIGLSYLW